MRPRYHARIEQRTYRQEPGGLSFTGRPDVVVASPKVAYQIASAVEILPVKVPIPDIERETYLDVETGNGKNITRLETPSPGNKLPDRGRSMYEHKRTRMLESRTHLVEIDFRRVDQPMTLPLLEGDGAVWTDALLREDGF